MGRPVFKQEFEEEELRLYFELPIIEASYHQKTCLKCKNECLFLHEFRGKFLKRIRFLCDLCNRRAQNEVNIFYQITNP